MVSSEHSPNSTASNESQNDENESGEKDVPSPPLLLLQVVRFLSKQTNAPMMIWIFLTTMRTGGQERYIQDRRFSHYPRDSTNPSIMDG